VKYRDAQCAWESAAFQGGSIQPLVLATCFRRLTEERIAILKHQLCEGGGDCDAARKYDPPGQASPL
jgi:hypothetical protein